MRKRTATIALTGAIWLAASCPGPVDIPVFLRAGPNGNVLILQASATLATLAAIVEGLRGFGLIAAVGQVCLLVAGLYLRDSSYEMVAAHLAFYGALLGVAGLAARAGRPVNDPPKGRSFLLQDGAIFVVTLVTAALVSRWTFGGFVFNGDEIANTFQADVLGHFRAYAPIPPCPTMFENYWVFHYQGRAFSQYTPGWPLFMAAFQRFGGIWLAGPTMAGIVAVGVARLSRRVAWGLGGTSVEAARIVGLAGPIGAVCAMLGPSMLLNGASRFSHTMVCACFAWAVESLCAITEPERTRWRTWAYGALLGASTAFGVATRPADGGMLGVGVFVYFVWSLYRRRIGWRSFVATAVAFTLVTGLTLVILRLQLGAWFRTGYSIAGTFHSEAELKLSLPEPHFVKLAIPLATGSYCWWPAAPALGLAGLIQALGGRERRVALILNMSSACLTVFYFFVEFGRFAYDGLGPRYVLPVVVAISAGGAGILAPIVARLANFVERGVGFGARFRALLSAGVVMAAVVFGVYRIAPMVYPGARAENRLYTAPLRAAANRNLKNAIVILEPGRVPAHVTNLAQNAPMSPRRDVLFLTLQSAADEECARRTFPGRKWYRANMGETLTPY